MGWGVFNFFVFLWTFISRESGYWSHQRKDGGADKRYSNNHFHHHYDFDTQDKIKKIGTAGMVMSVILAIILGIAAVSPAFSFGIFIMADFILVMIWDGLSKRIREVMSESEEKRKEAEKLKKSNEALTHISNMMSDYLQFEKGNPRDIFKSALQPLNSSATTAYTVNNSRKTATDSVVKNPDGGYGAGSTYEEKQIEPVNELEKAVNEVNRLQGIINTGIELANRDIDEMQQKRALKPEFKENKTYEELNKERIKSVDERVPLIDAINDGNLELVRLLLNKEADINSKDPDGNTALMLAIFHDNIGITSLLLDRGVDVNAFNQDGNTALHCAVGVVDTSSVEAMKMGSATVSAIEMLLDNGSDINAKNGDGCTPLLVLYSSCCGQSVAVAKTLIDRGADVNALDKDGDTALHYAFRWAASFDTDNSATVAMKVLLDNGADIDANNKDGCTPLVFFFKEYCGEHCPRGIDVNAVKIFINRGANVNASDQYGNTALHWAAISGGVNFTAALEVLLDNGCDINARNRDGCTPLFFASCCNKIKAVETLLERGADDSIKGTAGETALEIARRNGYENIVSLLKTYNQTRMISQLHNLSTGDLNETINRHQFNTAETIILDLHEYKGPIVIDKKVGLIGPDNGTTICGKDSPVVKIEADHVHLKNIKIEFTGKDDNGIALEISGANVVLENIEVKGAVKGMPGEEGRWAYPFVINLGDVCQGAQDFQIQIIVPVACSIESEVTGLSINPDELLPGENNVAFSLGSFRKGAYIDGHVLIKTPLLNRRIQVHARIIESLEPAPQPLNSSANNSRKTATDSVVKNPDGGYGAGSLDQVIKKMGSDNMETAEEVQPKKAYSVEEHLSRANPDIQALFNDLRQRLLAMAPNIIEEAKTVYIAYKALTNFADIVVQKKSLKIYLNVASGQLTDPMGLARDLRNPQPIGHLGNGDYEVSVQSKEELDAVFDLIGQSYILNKEDRGDKRLQAEKFIPEPHNSATTAAVIDDNAHTADGVMKNPVAGLDPDSEDVEKIANTIWMEINSLGTGGVTEINRVR